MEASVMALVSDFINSVGFPIAVCIALFINNRENTKNHNKVMCEFKEVLKENTEALKDLANQRGK